jgi:hypothetical protein
MRKLTRTRIKRRVSIIPTSTILRVKSHVKEKAKMPSKRE